MGIRTRTEDRIEKAKEQKAKLKEQFEKAKSAGLNHMLKPILDLMFTVNADIQKFEERLQEI